MPLETLELHSNLRDYVVTFQPDTGFLGELVAMPNRAFVVDESVWRLHKDSTLAMLPAEEVFVLPIAEELKTLESVERVWDRLLESSARRNMTLVSIGGGICQDITGYAASTLYRGINWVFLPTTLLAQCDSCIGSKTSLNYHRYKNLLGTFYPPTAVHVHPPFLATQADSDFYSGLGELAKLHIMGGRENAEWLDANASAVAAREAAPLHEAVVRALSIKRDYIESDEFDLGRRNLLNYGHCFGHAIEAATDFAIPHGQAVVFGMVIAQEVARRRGLETDAAQIALVDRMLAAVLHSSFSIDGLDIEASIEAMKHDKKRTGEGLVVVVAADGYEMLKLDDVSIAGAREALESVVGESR